MVPVSISLQSSVLQGNEIYYRNECINFVTFFRINLPSGSIMVDNFQQTFPRAKQFQSRLALALAIHGVAQFAADMGNPGAKFFLAAGISFASLIPWTLVMIMPINYQLMDGDVPKKKGDEWIKVMMNGWDRVHLVRTLLGALGFGLSIAGILATKQ